MHRARGELLDGRVGCSYGKAALGKADGPVIIDGVLYAFSSDWETDVVPVADKTLPAGTDLNAITNLMNTSRT